MFPEERETPEINPINHPDNDVVPEEYLDLVPDVVDLDETGLDDLLPEVSDNDAILED